MQVTIVDDYYTTALEEMAPSPTFSLTPDMTEAEEILLCNSFEDAFTEAANFIGRVIATGAGQITLYLPARFQHTAFIDLRADRVTMEPFGGSNQSPVDATSLTYQKAVIRVHYSVAPFDRLLLLVDEEFRPTTEFITSPHIKLYWDNAQAYPLRSEEAPSRTVQLTEWNYVIKRLPYLEAKYSTYQGAINSAAMASTKYPTRTFAAGTVMYAGADVSDTIDWTGAMVHDVSMRFMYRPDGWHKWPRAGYAAFQSIYNSSGNLFTPYDEQDLSELLLTT